MKLDIQIDQWALHEPFVTARETTTHIRTVTAVLIENGQRGRGEALGVDYLGETADSMAAQLESVRAEIERKPPNSPGARQRRSRNEGHNHNLNFHAISEMLPAGGARNALDCALWDLRARQQGRRVWQMLGMEVQPVTTVYTLSMGDGDDMAREALLHAQFPILKLKLGADDTAEKLRAIRDARPDAGLIIDGNGSWSMELLDRMMDVLLECRVSMLEQPLEMGQDEALAGLNYPVTLCADESCQHAGDLPGLAGRYHMVNIKLDKCGGLSEALRMVDWCRQNGLKLMVGNMLGSSLAMAPGFVVAQHCQFTDLDGPLWQRTDRDPPLDIENGVIQPPEAALWG